MREWMTRKGFSNDKRPLWNISQRIDRFIAISMFLLRRLEFICVFTDLAQCFCFEWTENQRENHIVTKTQQFSCFHFSFKTTKQKEEEEEEEEVDVVSFNRWPIVESMHLLQNLAAETVTLLFPCSQSASIQQSSSFAKCHNNRILTPRRAIASLSNCTTSSPTTPEQLKPFVHLTSIPFVRPSCCNGNENVNPNGNRSLYTSFSY